MTYKKIILSFCKLFEKTGNDDSLFTAIAFFSVLLFFNILATVKLIDFIFNTQMTYDKSAILTMVVSSTIIHFFIFYKNLKLEISRKSALYLNSDIKISVYILILTLIYSFGVMALIPKTI